MGEMEIGNTFNEELKLYNKEKILFEKQIDIAKNSFIDEIKNGLGEQIKYDLQNPIKPKKKDILKYKIKRKIKNFFKLF